MATATNTYNINVNATQAERALAGLKGSLQNTNSLFGQLKGAIAGLAIGSFIANAVKMAGALDDISKATGISLTAILDFQKAVHGGGVNAEQASTGISKFSQAIDAAASGSKEMQDRFLRLGITLNELRTLSEEEILRQIIDELGRSGASAKTAADGMAIFGKAFRAVNYGEVASGLNAVNQETARHARAVAAAAAAEDSLGNSLIILQRELLRTLAPIAELAAKILESSESVATFIRVAVQIGTVVLAFTVLGRVVAIVRTAFAGIAGVLGSVGKFFYSSASGANSWKNILTEIINLPFVEKLKLIPLALKELLGWILKNIPALGALGVAISQLADSFDGIFGKVKEWLGLGDEQKNKTQEITAEEKKRQDAARQAAREVQDAMQKERDALDKILSGYKAANQQALEKYKLDTEMLDMSERQKLAAQEVETAYTNYMAEYIKLRDEFNAKLKSGSESEKALLPEITAKMEQLSAAYYQQKNAVQELAASRATALEQQQLELFRTKERIDLENQLMEIQHSMATGTLSEIDKKYADIEFSARKSAKAAIEAEEARRNAKMPIEEQQKYYDTVLKGTDQLKRLTSEQYEQSRSFSYGWDKAFNEYADNAKNAATQAQQIFREVTQGMEDMIVNFAKTGKFEWKGFLNSIVEDLLRSQIRQLMANVFSLGGSGSTGSGKSGLLGLGGAFGFLASGGPASSNRAYIVGERGPELFVPDSNGTVVPNSALGGGTVVNYNISAVDAQSFKQMVARDPQFLYAVTEQGRRSLPGGR